MRVLATLALFCLCVATGFAGIGTGASTTSDQSARALYFEAENAYRLGQYDEAFTKLGAARQALNGSNPRILYLSYLINKAKGNRTQADQDLRSFSETASTNDPNGPALATEVNAALERLRQRRIANAAEEVTKVLKEFVPAQGFYGAVTGNSRYSMSLTTFDASAVPQGPVFDSVFGDAHYLAQTDNRRVA